MELYPAIDVQSGRVARSRTSDEPLAVARRLARDGARWVHYVDLDRAHGTGDNRELTRRFLAEAGLAVEVSGGVVAEETVAELLAWGARRVVLGSRAAVDATLVERLCARHGAEQLAVAIDARDGRVAPREAGSPAVLDIAPVDLARRVRACGARTVVYTDAARDGRLAGPDLEGARAIASLEGGLDVIVSGGIASLDDLRRAADAGLAGAIVGRALHEGRFTLAEALACAGA